MVNSAPASSPSPSDRTGTATVVEIVGLGFGGEGYARTDDGRYVSVPHTLPGDRVEVLLGRFRRGRRAWAQVVRWIERSPQHQDPDCPFYDQCSGCAVRHMSERDEREWKLAAVRQILERYGPAEANRLPVDWVDVGCRREHRARGRFRVSVGDNGEVAIGLRSLDIGSRTATSERGRSEDGQRQRAKVVDIRKCPAQRREFIRAIGVVGDLLDTDLELARRVDTVHVWTTESPSSVPDAAAPLVILATRTDLSAEQSAAIRSTVKAQRLSVGWQLVDSDGPPVMAEGLASIRYPFGGHLGVNSRHSAGAGSEIAVQVPWGSWYPANPDAAELMVGWALNRLEEHHRFVLDLCSGVGTVSVALALDGRQVLAVDEDHRALTALSRATAEANLDGLTVRPGRLSSVLRKLRRELAAGERPTAAVVNPMRRPLGRKELADLAPLGVGQIIYLGPSAVSAARDAKVLADLGYHLEDAAAINLHPATAQVMLGLDLRMVTTGDMPMVVK